MQNGTFEVAIAVLLRFKSYDVCAVLLCDKRCLEGSSSLNLQGEVVEEEEWRFDPSKLCKALA